MSNEEMAPTDEAQNAKDEPMNIARTLRNFRSYRNTVNELDRLSNRELADLGLSRGDIRAVARQSVR